ncbi:MAG: filamentous hemagglutinin N-terminal domain-containing protein [Leptolyngbyaceae cyanobacterium]
MFLKILAPIVLIAMPPIFKLSLLGGAIALSSLASPFNTPAIAQITPDPSLGSEHSSIHHDVQVLGELGSRIDGGAIRGSHLFHSFSDFNVDSLQRVYFSNPALVDHIISRVTGNSQSDILGTLGVLGNANLYLINPNGIVFGPDDVLDINGAFTSSTADSILFDSGYAFRATDANALPLLNVTDSIAGLQSWLPQSGTISVSGPLKVGNDLALTAETVNVQGGVMAGGDVRLIAANRLFMWDNSTTPLLVLANQNLILQGNQSLEIAALSHPSSQLIANNHLTLRSDSPVVGDGVFQSSGNIQIERLDGRLGALISVDDPVFQTAGDFAVDNYEGASLQILAGGSVTIPGGITIDTAGGPFNDSTVELSNGTSLAINGSTEPTVDIRAGTTQFFGTVSSGDPTSADISIGTIDNPGGLVYLTNQFQPNPNLSGDIRTGSITTADRSGGGAIVIDSRGEFSFDNRINASGGELSDIATFGLTTDAFPGSGGDITLLAADELFMPYVEFPRSLIVSFGNGGGDILLASDTAIIQESAPLGTDPFASSEIQSLGVGNGANGDVSLSAPFTSIGGSVLTAAYGEARSGDISIVVDRLETDQATILTDTFSSADSGDITVIATEAIALDLSLLGTSTESDSGGRGGDVTIRTGALTGIRGAQIGSLAFFNGDAGNVTVVADTISLSGFQPLSSFQPDEDPIFAPSSIFSTVEFGVEGNSGNVHINTRTLELLSGANISTDSLGFGDTGQIEVIASESIRIDGAVFFISFDEVTHSSSISSEIVPGAVGEGGGIVIQTGSLEVTNGGTVTTSSDGIGDAGSIRIEATDTVTFDGIRTFDDIRTFDEIIPPRISQAAVFVGREAIGNAGSIIINAPSLILSNGGRVTAEALGIPTTASNAGGAIRLNIADVISLGGGSRISATSGTSGSGGNGGNITIGTTYLIASPSSNSDISANAFEGQGGIVDITAAGIFGLVPRSRADLEDLLGTDDPAALDPINLTSNDIKAISQVNPNLDGMIFVRSPDVDPSGSITPLPTNTVDVSQLIAQGCSAGGAVAQEIGSLIVTGRGGLPQNPGTPLSYQDLALDWDGVEFALPSPPATERVPNQTASQSQSFSQEVQVTGTPLIEVQALTRRADGQVILTATTATGNLSTHGNQAVTCVSPTP